MLKLDQPTFLPSEVLINSISNYTDHNLKERLASCKDEIDRLSRIFEHHVINTTLHTLPPQDGVLGIVTKEEMKKVYNDKFAKMGQPGRPYYNEILAKPKFGRCPLCGQRKVSTLDHHLPKTKYPALAVTPSNLIPSCFDCNKLKTSGVPKNQEEETIHPYFEDVQSHRWLFAQVIEHGFPALRFFIRYNPSWSPLKNKRIENHFFNFELAELYSSYAGEELSNQAYNWKLIHDTTKRVGGDEAASEAVKAQLLDFANSCLRARLNSWQSATYEALANSKWFCSEGIFNITA